MQATHFSHTISYIRKVNDTTLSRKLFTHIKKIIIKTELGNFFSLKIEVDLLCYSHILCRFIVACTLHSQKSCSVQFIVGFQGLNQEEYCSFNQVCNNNMRLAHFMGSSLIQIVTGFRPIFDLNTKSVVGAFQYNIKSQFDAVF